MEIVIESSAEKATDVVVRLVSSVIRKKPNAVLGLATGATVLLFYRKLVEMKLDWSKITAFNLDEYVGLPPRHPHSFHRFMWENLFRHVNIRKKNVHIPDGLAADIPKSCERYERKIVAAGGIDLQLLGIGTGGHIGFNEPTSSLASRTRIKTLTPRTRKDNAPFFGAPAQVPHHCITMGIGTILDARHCVLLAFGKKKARAVAQAVEGPVSALVPASALQLHPRVTVLLDTQAASRLKLKRYYRWVSDHKPAGTDSA